MNRRAFLSEFLALPVAVRFARYQKPLPREFEHFNLTLTMMPMTAEQLTLSDEDKAFMLGFNRGALHMDDKPEHWEADADEVWGWQRGGTTFNFSPINRRRP